MANQILVDPFPGGKDITTQAQTLRGSVALAGSAVSTGEPLNWTDLVTGVGYNDINRLGDGARGSATALVTAFSAASGIVTATANNNFAAGQFLTFVGCTSVLGLLLNGATVQVLTATPTTFTFASTATGTGTGEVGLANGTNQEHPLQGGNNVLTGSVTALSASGGVVTVTAANNLLPGAQVVVTSSTSGIGAAISGKTFSVISATASAFTIASTTTGATGTGTFSAVNPPQPFSVKFWSENGSGYVYQYSRPTGVLYVMVQGAAAQAALAPLSAGAYPAGVLNDIVRYEATFLKS